MKAHPIHYRRVFGYALLAEVVTIVLIVAVLFIHSHVIAAGEPQSVIDDFAQRAPTFIGPVAGVLFTLLAAIRATRPLTDRFRTHGVLLGVIGAALTLPGLISGAAAVRPIYLAAIVAKVGAGFLGGVFSESQHAEAAG